MKYRLFSLLAFAGVLFSSCVKENFPAEGGSILAVMENDDTRTSVTDEGVFTWSEGDKVWLHTTLEGVVGTLSSGAELEEKDYSLLVRMSMDHDDEDAIIRDWIATSNVDAMLLLNLEIGDSRIETMKQNPQMPVLAVADASLTAGLPTLASDDAAAVGLAVRHLYDLGHRSIARVAGPEELGHSYIRDAAFSEATTELGIRYRCLHTDYTPASGADATRRLLSVNPSPTAIIYDNDVMALAGESVAAIQGVRVPEDLSIMSWDDSFMCEAAHPGITALNRDIVRSGHMAASLMLKLIDGGRYR